MKIKKSNAKKSCQIEAFGQWLKSVPDLSDGEQDINRDITVNLPITISLCDWMFVAEAAALHGWKIEEVLNYMIHSLHHGITEWSNSDYKLEDGDLDSAIPDTVHTLRIANPNN